MEDTINDFISKLDKNLLWVPSRDYLNEIVGLIEEITIANQNKAVPFKAILGLSYFNFPAAASDSLLLRRISELLKAHIEANPGSLDRFILEIRPMLANSNGHDISPSGRYQRESKSFTLQPQLGFDDNSEDEMWETWRKVGGMRSLGLFYTILTTLRQEQFSANLWWITPGIVNLMRDTTVGSSNVKLNGVFLLQTFLQACICQGKSKKFIFSNTGLYKLYDPMLKSLTYSLPPSFEPSTTLEIWKIVYPTLLLLFKAEFSDDSENYLKAVGSLFSENILQLTLPRIGYEYTELAKWILYYSKELVDILSVNTTIYLQRIIYAFGETFIRNPFITLEMDIMESCIELFTCVSLNCIPDSIVNQKFDLLACVLIAFEKATNEGTLTPAFENRCLTLLSSLKSCGCDFTDEINSLKHRQALVPLLDQIIG